MIISTCPGCGATINSQKSGFDTGFNATSACIAKYHELSIYTLQLRDTEFIHQLIVDAYAAQHASKNMPHVTATFALIGLYLVCNHGYTGKQAQRAHMILANKTKDWPQFLPDCRKAELTVVDVLDCSDDIKKEMIRKWAKAVWDSWEHQHARVKELVDKYLFA